MKANELRIGNLVRYKESVHNFAGKITTVTEIVFDTIDLYDAIPLTEECLLKFGFVNKDFNYIIDNDRFEFSMMFYDSWNIYYKEKESFGRDEINLTGFWKIHELQNLFFALCGEELTLK